ncbi:MAG: hypothetical protein ACC631_05770, partial [Halocynthiibacter sp.]
MRKLHLLTNQTGHAQPAQWKGRDASDHQAQNTGGHHWRRPGRIRAAVLEQGLADMLRGADVGARMDR